MDEAIRIGIIGGSGLYEMEALTEVTEVEVATPFGPPSDTIITGKIEGVPVAFLPRHGRGHRLTPTAVPYRANIWALKSLGVERILSVSACGSLREDLHPGEIVIPDQLVDFTRRRESSFFGEGLVGHISAAEPFCPQSSALLAEALEAEGGIVHRGGTFITIEGPRFSTKAESHLFRSWGLSIIGMTTSPEAFLAREAGLCYAVMAHITDYDVWHESEAAVTVEMVIRRLQANLDLARRAIVRLVPKLASTPRTCDCAHALDVAMITDPAHIPPKQAEWLRFLRGQPRRD